MDEMLKKKLPRAINPQETQPTDNEEVQGAADRASIPTVAEEAVLTKLHEAADKCKKDQEKPDEQTLEVFHKDIEKCECYPLLQKYTSGEVPSLKRMFSNVKNVVHDMEKEIAAEEASAEGKPSEYLKSLTDTKNLLAGRELAIRSSVVRYVNSVIRFSRVQKSTLGGQLDDAKQFLAADHARRRAHESLIESLNVYATIVQKMIGEGYPDTSGNFKYERWKIGEDARLLDTRKSVIFDSSVMRNREFIKDWAIVADFVEQLESLGDTTLSLNKEDHSAK